MLLRSEYRHEPMNRLVWVVEPASRIATLIDVCEPHEHRT